MTREEKIRLLCTKNLVPIVEVNGADWDNTFNYSSNVVIVSNGEVLDLVADYDQISKEFAKCKYPKRHVEEIEKFILSNENSTYFEALDNSIKMALYLSEIIWTN